MSFYLRPPKGFINLHMLGECVNQRLKCYEIISEENCDFAVINMEYLIEDSILDRTGHFIFRLAAFLNRLFKETFIKKELELLSKRLEFYEVNDMKYFIKTLIRQIRDCFIDKKLYLELRVFLKNFLNFCNGLLKDGYLEHTFNEPHTIKHEVCLKFTIKVPFEFCDILLSKRSVELHNGWALITCGLWKTCFLSFYYKFLNIALNEMKFSNTVGYCINDDRIKKCLTIIKNANVGNICSEKPDNNFSNMTLEKLEEETQYFPLCMKNLYDVLQKDHRLAHNDRYNFSVYLKEVGLSVNDSLKFWQGEYSKEHGKCSKCNHSWEKNEKRYIYGIRHLYGLEGSRKNYRVPSCSYFQESSLGINNQGGCPFIHYDDNFLRQTLKTNLKECEDEIELVISERNKNPMGACKVYYKTQFEKLGMKLFDTSTVNFQNPVQYYVSIKKQLR